MSFNTFGQMFRVTTFGESHGVAIGCVVDGCPPNLRFTVEEVQAALDRRRPGQSRFTPQRQEPDQVKVLSAGDAYLFDSRVPHRFRNIGPARCEVVSACTPPYL